MKPLGEEKEREAENNLEDVLKTLGMSWGEAQLLARDRNKWRATVESALLRLQRRG